MRKIYIDCGAWSGDSVLCFKQYHNDYDIYAFECSYQFEQELNELSSKHGFTFINKAVWVNNGDVNLYPGIGEHTQSGSLCLSKKKYIDKKSPEVIKAIDFSQWVIDEFDKDDYIICKMNIEGAEYDILEKMLVDGSAQYINRFYIAWHNTKLENFSEKRHNKIKKQINSITELSTWKYTGKENKDPFYGIRY